MAVTSRVPMPPADHLEWIGCPDEAQFHRVGDRYRRFLTEDLDLLGQHRFLDVGCGTGRMAMALIDDLAQDGAYVGFDAWRAGVEWCRREIASRHPRFRFVHADIAEPHLNPGGTVAPTAWRFPVEDGAIDRALALSVFTHLDAPTARHYLAELARALAPDGRALVTVFLIDDAAARHLAGWPGGEALLAGPRDPMLARFGKDLFAAWDPAQLAAAVADSGLAIDRTEPGDWCGRAPARPDRPHHQDHLYLSRAA
ncbi:MAG: class I SAM-dependent methyltransferase [Alphaproteobacteria bacterium]